MNLNLSSDLQTFVDAQVAAGNFANADEVVLAALQRLRDEQRELEQLKAEVQVGLDDVEQGRVGPWDVNEVIDRLRAKQSSKT